MIQLRPYQQQLDADISNAMNAGARAVLGVLPTGGGKSVVISERVSRDHIAGAKQCVIAHRTELVAQMSLHIGRRGIRHALIAPKNVIAQTIKEHRATFNGQSFVVPNANCSVGGVDTILARSESLASWAFQIDNWTIDEAHHVLKQNKWGKVAAMFQNARGLGVTATPSRADGMGLGAHHDGVFEAMVEGPSMRQLIDQGALCDYEIVAPESDFLIDDDAITKTGDYSHNKMKVASEKSQIVGDVVQEYCKRAYGKRSIVFATDVETSNRMAAQFNDAGIPAASVSAKTPGDVRAEYIRRFREGKLWVLVNVDLFGEGFDVPSVEVVQMARPTASLAVYLQQFGRALRLLEGKAIGLIIDHVSNYKRHGLPDQPRVWTLDKRDRRGKREPHPEEIPLTSCRDCSRPYERFHKACPYCGHEPVIEGGGRTIEQVDGDLVLLDRELLAKMRAALELETPEQVGARVEYKAGKIAGKGAENKQRARIEQQTALAETIDQWAGLQVAKGRDLSQTYRRFYIATGMTTIEALAMKRVDMEALQEKVQSWLTETALPASAA